MARILHWQLSFGYLADTSNGTGGGAGYPLVNSLCLKHALCGGLRLLHRPPLLVKKVKRECRFEGKAKNPEARTKTSRIALDDKGHDPPAQVRPLPRP